jgi:hypothetical protein
MGSASPHLVNATLGAWLFLSAFVWPHSHAQMTNMWICGVLCVVFAITGLGVPWARYLNTALAIWLFVSAWALLPTPIAAHVAGTWNNILCAIAIFVVSLVPSEPDNLPARGARMGPPRSLA